MRVVYKSSVLDGIKDWISIASSDGKVIDYIELTKDECDRLGVELSEYGFGKYSVPEKCNTVLGINIKQEA
jgi:hypothetical protein